MPAVHPMQPRFAQAITGVLCLEAIVFDQPAAVAVALGLVLLALAGPRYSPVAWLFRLVARPPGRSQIQTRLRRRRWRFCTWARRRRGGSSPAW